MIETALVVTLCLAVLLYVAIVAQGASKAIASVGEGIGERAETALSAPWWAYLPVLGLFYDWEDDDSASAGEGEAAAGAAPPTPAVESSNYAWVQWVWLGFCAVGFVVIGWCWYRERRGRRRG